MVWSRVLVWSMGLVLALVWDWSSETECKIGIFSVLYYRHDESLGQIYKEKSLHICEQEYSSGESSLIPRLCCKVVLLFVDLL